MPLGYGLLIFALVATVVANVLFTLSRRPGQAGLLRPARLAAVVATGGIVGASLYLMQLIGAHQFQVAYIAEHTSRRTSAAYLVAAFWGGQEGSLLLWGLWTAILGAVLAFKGGSDVRTARVWPIFGMVQIYLLALLLVRSPFALGTGSAPADGRGLNPSLENYWILIHPPILFLGFASTVIPAVWAVYGMIHRDWDGWAKASFPWTLFSFATLGFGLSLGGYWAYETLGWGGFWAWDPVENTSLVPWLFLAALLHGLAIQVKNGGVRPLNIVLAILPFATMNYGTFLTRTGVLADFSVHAFVGSDRRDFYFVLLGGTLIATFAPLVLLLTRLRQMPRARVFEGAGDRTFGFFLGTSILALMGLFVAVGMSAPLISRLWTAKGAAAEASFYNQATFPFAILMTLLMAVTPYLSWKETGFDSVRRRLLAPYLGAIFMTLCLTGAAYYMGQRKPAQVLLFATSLFTVLANLQLVLPRLKTPAARGSIGGFLAHMGAGLTLAGIAALVAFSQTVDGIMLMKDKPVQVLGYTLTYLGNLTQPFDKEHNAYRIRVEKDGQAFESRPRFYYTPWEARDYPVMTPPAVHRRFWGDLYVAYAGEVRLGDQDREIVDDPRAQSSNNQFSLKEGETKAFGDYTFTLLKMTLDEKAQASGSVTAMSKLPYVTLLAQVAVTYQGKETIVTPGILHEQGRDPKGEPVVRGVTSQVATLPGPAGGPPVVLRFCPPPSESEVSQGQGQLQAAIAEAKLAGAPGTTAFQQKLIELGGAALIQDSQLLEARRNFQVGVFETFNAPDPQEGVVVSLGTKPLIWFVWLGTILYSLGGVIAYRRRALEAAREPGAS
jgi:cytochrome c-type biogenesis protein CcmF